jgi:hypothetical protein
MYLPILLYVNFLQERKSSRKLRFETKRDIIMSDTTTHNTCISTIL